MKAEEYLTQEKIDKLQCDMDDNNGIVDDEKIAQLMEAYHESKVKDLGLQNVSKRFSLDDMGRIIKTVDTLDELKFVLGI